MARVLPSGRVFGEVHRLPNIQYAKGDDAFGRLEKLSESNLASIAVAGIDRIRKEIALNEAEEAEAKRLAETRRKLEELKGERSRWEAQKAREAEARQAAQAPTMPARPMVPVERGTMPSPATQQVIEAAGGQILPTQHPGPLRAGGPVATRPGEVQWAALTPEQRAFAHAVHSHPLAPKHLQQQAVAHGSDMQGDRRYGWGQHSENTLAEIQAAGLVWDGSRFVAQQPQAVVAEESIYAPAREQRLADINEQMAALQKQMQPMPTPRTGAEFIYAVMQETDPRRRAALLYQARNAIGDSPATIQEAFSGAATMRMQEKMLKGMSLADAAALAAKEFNVKESTLKVRQGQLKVAQDRAKKEEENINSLISKRNKDIEKLNAEIEKLARKPGKGGQTRRLFTAEVIRDVAAERISFEEGVARLRSKGIKEDALKTIQTRRDKINAAIDKQLSDEDERAARANAAAERAKAAKITNEERMVIQAKQSIHRSKSSLLATTLRNLTDLQRSQFRDKEHQENLKAAKEAVAAARAAALQAETELRGAIPTTAVSVEEEETVDTPTQTITIRADGSIEESE